MKTNNNQFPSFVEAAPQPYWSGFNDGSAAQQDSSAGVENVSPRKDKKPYGKPTYRYERVFETMALSCGKISPVEFQCRFNRRNS